MISNVACISLPHSAQPLSIDPKSNDSDAIGLVAAPDPALRHQEWYRDEP